ncbi:tyrosine-type recombinase/integrase [Agrobacterium rhizogenes]|nr:tyrosine-type recombinase/integrase [Rhizobium rhizogenes]
MTLPSDEEMPKDLPKHVTKTITRYGKVLFYFRIDKGPRVRLPDNPKSHEFDVAYGACLASKPKPRSKAPAASRTAEWLIGRYMESAAWVTLSAGTRRQRSNIFKHAVEQSGQVEFSAITSKHIRNRLDQMASTPVQANNYLKAMNGLFQWAVKNDHRENNPCQGVERLTVKSDGFPAWTIEDAKAFRSIWAEGTMQRLAFELLLHVGSRRGDLTDMGRQHLRGNVLSFRTGKTGSVVTVELPQYVLDLIEKTEVKKGVLHFIVTSHGKPFSKPGFGNWFGEAARKADVFKNAHGLRKLAATVAADEGATAHELMAQFGWANPKQAEVYTRGADRAKLGIRSSKRVAERVKNEVPPNSAPEAPKHLPETLGNKAS